MRSSRLIPRSRRKQGLPIKKGIDDAVYGLRMVIDGVTGSLRHADHQVFIDFIVRFTGRE
jgi:hypothetical protein